MKKLLLLATAIAFAGSVSAAYAVPTGTLTGEVDITGSVAAKCSVVTAGTNPEGQDFGSTIALGELAGTDGTLKTALSGTTSGSPAGGVQNFRINCTGAGNAITLKADPIVAATSAPTGYANTVNFTAEADYAVVGGTSPVVQSHTSDSTTNNASFPAGVRLANAANNVQIQVYGLATPNAGDILVADPSYLGHVTVTISPGA
jgi:hypothetical protein